MGPRQAAGFLVWPMGLFFLHSLATWLFIKLLTYINTEYQQYINSIPLNCWSWPVIVFGLVLRDFE